MPSLPVAEPTMNTGFPGPFAFAEMIFLESINPTDIALTRQLLWYDSSKYTSPPTVGIPNALP
jgi:hypothetical protein